MRLEVTLGGSAFNAIYALTQLDLGMRLGFVGVAGRVPEDGMSSVARLDELGVDRRFVREDDSQSSGICFSFAAGGERTLLTHNGANAAVADHIDREFDRLVDYLSSARVVHVTSFLDTAAPARLLALLRAVREASHNLTISFDPGYEWAVGGGYAVEGIARLSDLLIMNEEEFRALGGHDPGEDDRAVAARLFRRIGGRPVLTVKHSDRVRTYRLESGRVRTDQQTHESLPAAQIEDSTGAGDVFAAGLLAVLASERIQVQLGCALGMRMARHTLRYIGVEGHAGLPAIAREFVSSKGDGDTADLRESRPPFVST